MYMNTHFFCKWLTCSRNDSIIIVNEKNTCLSFNHKYLQLRNYNFSTHNFLLLHSWAIMHATISMGILCHEFSFFNFLFILYFPLPLLFSTY